MRFTEIKSFKPILIARRYVRRTPTPIDPTALAFLKIHVKKENQGYLYINQYDDQWYQYTFKDPTISDFKDFFKLKISPYFEIINTDNL